MSKKLQKKRYSQTVCVELFFKWSKKQPLSFCVVFVFVFVFVFVVVAFIYAQNDEDGGGRVGALVRVRFLFFSLFLSSRR